jgi:excisionase family DNA binding protein
MNNLLTVSEVAKILRVDDASIRRWVANGVLEAIRLPSKSGLHQGYRIRRETLDKVLNTPVVPTLASR